MYKSLAKIKTPSHWRRFSAQRHEKAPLRLRRRAAFLFVFLIQMQTDGTYGRTIAVVRFHVRSIPPYPIFLFIIATFLLLVKKVPLFPAAQKLQNRVLPTEGRFAKLCSTSYIGCEEKEYPVDPKQRERRTVEAPREETGEVVSELRPERLTPK